MSFDPRVDFGVGSENVSIRSQDPLRLRHAAKRTDRSVLNLPLKGSFGFRTVFFERCQPLDPIFVHGSVDVKLSRERILPISNGVWK